MEFNDLSSQVVTRKTEHGMCVVPPDVMREDDEILNELCVQDNSETKVENASGNPCTNCIVNGVNGNEIEITSNLVVSASDSTVYKTLSHQAPSFSEECVYTRDKKSLSNRNRFGKDETNACKKWWSAGPNNTTKKMCFANGRKDDNDLLYQLDNASNASVESKKVKCNDGDVGATGGFYGAQVSESSSSITDVVSPEMDFIEFDFEEQNASGDEVRSENSSESRTQSPQLENDIYGISAKNDLGEPSGFQRNSFVHNLSFQNVGSSPTPIYNCLKVNSNSNNDEMHNAEDGFSDNTDSDSANMELCNERFLAQESSLFNIQNEEMDWSDYNVQSALLCSYNSKQMGNKRSCDSPVNSSAEVNESSRENEVEENIEKTMIWSEMDACTRQVTQIGPSTCGAVAVINVLMALNMTYDKKVIESYVCTRYRAETAPIAKYLISRSKAGTTHEELIKGVEKITKGEVFGRFFAMYPARDIQILAWLSSWIKKGAVPIATLNLQCGLSAGQSIPDSWHHQMVFGVGPKGVYLTNPLECVRVSQFKQQTCSESVLLVRRGDVIGRWDNDCDLSPLVLEGSRWCDLNVLGQVINVLRESTSPWVPGHRRYLMSHVKVPAAYKSGVTLFARKGSDVYAELMSCPD
uniref:Uncharacterized protein n=1 Tax=Strigamia maritima TaxID=126957 RepID=T1ISC1_STRMM